MIEEVFDGESIDLGLERREELSAKLEDLMKRAFVVLQSEDSLANRVLIDEYFAFPFNELVDLFGYSSEKEWFVGATLDLSYAQKLPSNRFNDKKLIKLPIIRLPGLSFPVALEFLAKQYGTLYVSRYVKFICRGAKRRDTLYEIRDILANPKKKGSKAVEFVNEAALEEKRRLAGCARIAEIMRWEHHEAIQSARDAADWEETLRTAKVRENIRIRVNKLSGGFEPNE